jgi:arylsulfatase A-like enzyme
MPTLNRRDFLKLASLAPLLYMGAPRFSLQRGAAGQKNVIILVYDAWSATNVGLFGYRRDTMPRLAEIADQAIVYHNHHAGSDFTSPGTATLLTGTLPWTHRAVNYAGTIVGGREQHNIFRAFENYYSVGYSHNVLVNALLRQLSHEMDSYLQIYEMMVQFDFFEKIFIRDPDLSSVSRYYLFNRENPLTNATFLSELSEAYNQRATQRVLEEYNHQFPLGLPEASKSSSLTLEHTHQRLLETLLGLPQPFMGYFHFLPPHAPYTTRADFVDRFDDGWRPLRKPQHFFDSQARPSAIPRWRQQYDEFISYVDAEFGKFFDRLVESGLLENTILVLTSDHGEINERGLVLHGKNVFYDPIMKVPLLIFDPDRRERVDIYDPTSAIDIMPTLLQLTGQPIPEWAEGQVLAPYRAAAENESRSVFSMAAVDSNQNRPFSVGTYALLRDGYKYTYYEGYEELPDGQPYHEMYHLETDPEELENLVDSERGIAEAMLDEITENKNQADEPFR